MRRLPRIIPYLGSFICAFLLAANISFAQCFITNLNSEYCTDAAAVTLTSSPVGLTFYRTGSASAITQFNPSGLSAGTYTVVGVNPAVTTYNVITTGSYNPIAGTGTAVTGLGNNSISSAITIPFTFYFYGTGHTSLRISPNGYIDFGAATSRDDPHNPMPNTGDPDEIIAGAWTNLDLNEGGTIDYFTIGTAPFRRFIVNFNGVEYDGALSNTVSFQIQLHESTNVIEIHSSSIQSDGSTRRFQGIENAAGDQAYWAYDRNNTDWTATNDFVSFVPTCLDIQSVTVNAVPNAGLTVSPATTAICTGSSVAVTIGSAQAGVYYQLQNDADNSALSGFFAGNGTDLTINSNTLTSTTTIKVYAANASTLCDTYLTNEVTVTISNPPDVASAGPDRTKCNNANFSMAANTPVTGTGEWSFVGAPNGATIADVYSPNTLVSGQTLGTSITLRWTISTPGCTPSYDDVTLTYTTYPTADAGPDIIQCDNGIFTMAAVKPPSIDGTWTVVSGTANITNPASATTTVTGVPAGTSATLMWTLTHGCSPQPFDQVTITNSTLINTTVTGVPAGQSATLRWTVSSGSCAVTTDDV
ncbi:MAG TPA: hypothetical protein VFT90_10360, partial [Chryseosolibacter sp.]|nr:hypothetical protein [Chryseosolibacter sp.]